MASISSFFSSSLLKRTINPNSIVITSRSPAFFLNPRRQPVSFPGLFLACDPNDDPTDNRGKALPEIPSVPRTEPPPLPKELLVDLTRDPDTDPGVPPEIVTDPHPHIPMPNPNPNPKPDAPKPPLSPPGPDTPLPRSPDVVPPRPEIVPPPSTPPDIPPPGGPKIKL